MIKLILKGGLGNQMFQYGAAYAVAKRNNYQIGIDLSFMKNRLPVSGFTQRNYELDLFNILTPTCSLFNNYFLDKYLSYPLEKIAMKIGLYKSYIEKDIYAFDKKIFEIPDNTFIEGYFNNYKYFESYATDIKQIFNTDKLFEWVFFNTSHPKK